MEAHFDWYVNN